jgi:L-alanine-DL-glutamate epimerase-like enolase superfamily enzyme
MKITGYRSLATTHEWGRPIGDVNGIIASGVTEVPILLLMTDEGVTGVGLGDHSEIDRVFEAVAGQDPRGVSTLYDRMLAYVFKSGHGGKTFGTIGAVDMALWDLKAKINDEPLWRTLGGADRFVPGYASGLCYGLDDDGLTRLYTAFSDKGFSSAKLKGGIDIDRDIHRLELVRDLLLRNSPRPAMMFDANEAWNRKQAIRNVAEIEKAIDLTWIEEPVRRWDAEGLAAVSRAVRAAVATGENLTGLEQYTPLFLAGAVDIVQAGNVWGITHFLRTAMAAHAHNLPVSPVGYSANPLVHAATAVPNLLTVEIQDLGFPTGLKVDQQFADGGIVLGDAPGLGIEVDEARLVAPQTAANGVRVAGPHVRPSRAGLRLVPEDGAPRDTGPSVRIG